MVSVVVLLVILLSGPILVDSQCPVSNYATQCKCRWKPGVLNLPALFITCQEFQELPQLPEMNASSSRIEEFTIRDSTIDVIQAGAFDDLLISKLVIYKSGVLKIDKDAFQNLNKTLKELHLGENDLLTLDEGTFDNLQNLEYLGLQQNSLNTLHETIFIQLPNLSYLYLDSNNLKFLPVKIFSELKYLNGLYLQKNRIESLSSGIFSGFDYLKELDLSFNSLYVLPSNIFSHLKVLEKLGLSHNRIPSLPLLFKDTSHLQELDLSGNRITSLPVDIFQGCAALQKLNLANNYITELPSGSVEILRELRELHIENNRIEILPSNLFLNVTEIMLVYMHDNLIESLPSRLFRSCQDLQIVDLHNNLITTLPRDLFAEANALETLDLSENNISLTNTKMFENLLQLTSLNMADNQISYLPGRSFSSLLELQGLYLDRNLIPEVKIQDFEGATELRLLNLSHNVIRDIQAGSFELRVSNPILDKLSLAFNLLTKLRRNMFLGGDKLTVLELNNNLLEKVPEETFVDLNSLQYMYLQNNFIRDISNTSFSILPNLLLLDLSNNSLVSLPSHAFNSLKKLLKLDLSHNMIKTITPNAFFGMDSLMEIDIGHNKMNTLSEESLNGISVSLKHLSIAYNPLFCDCSIFWLRGYAAVAGYNVTVCMETEDSWKYVMCLDDMECPGGSMSLISPNHTLCMAQVPSFLTTTTTTTTTMPTTTTMTSTTSTETPTTMPEKAPVDAREKKSMKLVYIIIGCILGLFLLLALIIVCVMIRRKKRANEMEEKLVSDIGSSVNSNIPPEEIAGKTFDAYKIPTGNHKGAESLRWRSQGSELDGSNGQALPEIGELRIDLVDESDNVPEFTRERKFKKKSERTPVISVSNVEVNTIGDQDVHLDRELSRSSPILSMPFDAAGDAAEEQRQTDEDEEEPEQRLSQNIAVGEDDPAEISIEDNTMVEEESPENHDIDKEGETNEAFSGEDHVSPPQAPPLPPEIPVSPTRQNFMEGRAIPRSNDISRYYSLSADQRRPLDEPAPVVSDFTIKQTKGSVMDELGRRLSVVRGAFDERMGSKDDVIPPPAVQSTPSPHSAPSNSNFMQDAIQQLNAYQELKRRESSVVAIEEEESNDGYTELADNDSQKVYLMKSKPQGGEAVLDPQLRGSLDGMWPDTESELVPSSSGAPRSEAEEEGSTGF